MKKGMLELPLIASKTSTPINYFSKLVTNLVTKLVSFLAKNRCWYINCIDFGCYYFMTNSFGLCHPSNFEIWHSCNENDIVYNGQKPQLCVLSKSCSKRNQSLLALMTWRNKTYLLTSNVIILQYTHIPIVV